MKGISAIIWGFVIVFLAPRIACAQQTFAITSRAADNINLVSTNPAFVHMPHGKWAAGIFSLNGSIASNTGAISTSDIFQINSNFFRQNIIGTDRISTGAGVLEARGPSLAFGLTPKLSLAVTTRTRIHANYWQADGRLISEIGEIVKISHEYPYVMRREQMQMIASAFSEIGVSGSYLLFNNGRHQITLGVSINATSGTASSSISIPFLSGSIKKSNAILTSLSDATGEVSVQTSGKLLSDFTFSNLVRPARISLASTWGASYEYKPDPNEGYRLKFGLSVSDVGRLRFRADSAYSKSYNISIPDTSRLYFNNNFNNSTFSQTARVFDKYPEFFERTNVDSGIYSVGLPTSIHLVTDVRLTTHFFVQANGLLSLRRKNDISTLRSNGGVFIAPRWEKHNWAVAASLGFQEYSGISSGLSVKAGPVFVSANTLLSNSLGGSKQLQLAAGILLNSAMFK